MLTEDTVKHILEEHADHLTRLPNVVGVGLVALDNEESDFGVAVYVRSKVPETHLVPWEIVPRALTSTIAGVRVNVNTRVIEVGDITK